METGDQIWRGKTSPRRLPLLLLLAGLVPAVEGWGLRRVAADQPPPAATAETAETAESVQTDRREKGHRAKARLAIKLRLEKDTYHSRESGSATIVFRNRGKSLIKFPMVDGVQNLLFFDFVFVGDIGTQFLTNHGEGWSNPAVKQVNLIPLGAGETHTVRVKNALPFRAFDAAAYMGEQFKVVAIYRDHYYGHPATYPEYDKEDPAVWKGTVFSNPVTIKQITLREDR